MVRKQSGEHEPTHDGEDEHRDTLPPTDPYADWLTRGQVATLTGMTVGGVRRREKAGDFVGVKVRRGLVDTWVFDPAQFENFDATGDESAQSSFLTGAAATLRVQAELTKTSYDQQRSLVQEVFALLSGMSSAMHATLSEMVTKQHGQLLELQSKNFEMRKQYEESLNESNERELARTALDRELTSKDERWKQIAPLVNFIAASIAKEKLGLDFSKFSPGAVPVAPEVAPSSKPPATSSPSLDQNMWKGLIQSLSFEQGQRLVESGAFELSWIQTQFVPLREQFDRATSLEEEIPIALSTEAVLISMSDEQKTRFRAVLTPTQIHYLDEIEKGRT